VPHPSGAVGQPGTVCTVCGKQNPLGMNFCRSCGSSLQSKPKSGPSAAVNQRMPSAADVVGRKTPPSMPKPGKVRCGRCGAETPAGYKFCQQCGKPLLSGTDNELAQAATDPAEPSKRTPSPAASRPPGVRSIVHEGAQVDAVAATIAATGDNAAELVRQAEELARRRTIEEDPAVSSTLPETPVERIGHTPPPSAAVTESGRAAAVAGAWGRLVTVKQDGSDGQSHPLAHDAIEVGRSGSGLSFPSDRYLAHTHARIERADGGAAVVPVDQVNGVYRRVRGPVVLADGDLVLLGRELIRFELVTDEERDANPVIVAGVARFGSPAREPWGRLTILLPTLAPRDVRYLEGAEVVLGREEGDLVFEDDEFLSRRHAAFCWDGASCSLFDLKSSNGSYVRLRERTALEDGDFLRLGNQLFRFEAT